jgi:hypothetical protein
MRLITSEKYKYALGILMLRELHTLSLVRLYLVRLTNLLKNEIFHNLKKY